MDISPLAFVTGIVVSNQFLKDETIAYKREVDHLQTYGIWPQTWLPHKGNLLNLAMQIDREHATKHFKPDQPNNRTPGNN